MASNRASKARTQDEEIAGGQIRAELTTMAVSRRGRKRGNGEGSIYQRKDGLWTAQVTLEDGRRKYIYGKTRAEVAAKLPSVLRDVHPGLAVPTGRQSLGQFLDQWLEDAVRQKNANKTYLSYKGIVDVHLKPALGMRPLASLTAQDVQRFLRQKSTTATPSMVKHSRDVLRIALGQAKRWRLVAYNAAADTEPPRVAKRLVRAISLEEANAVLVLHHT